MAYHDDVVSRMSPEERRTHPQMNPHGVTRESRDSVEHPTSLAIGVLLDVTGSMARVPRIVQAQLCQLFGLLLRGVNDQPLVPHPQILIGAVGDAYCDHGPLQIGQFESGNEVDLDLGKLWLEGGGGGQNHESYELAMYFMARHTAIDCWERRQHKGYLFICGDELAYPAVARQQIQSVIGDTVDSSIPTPQIVTELRRRYNVYFVRMGGTTHYNEPWLIEGWNNLLGAEYVLTLPNPNAISATIATTVCLQESMVDYDALLAAIPEDQRGHVAVATDIVRRMPRRVVVGDPA
jgi:hypothetical protein